MKKILIYFPFPKRDMKSGSAVRPQKIINAFIDFGKGNQIEIIEIYGDSKERKRKLKEIYNNYNAHDILYCYMENSTLPIWLTDEDHIPRSPLLEWRFFKYLKKNRIPIGLFYRDAYWNFNDEYPLKGIKRKLMQTIYKIELSLYKNYIDHYFLPSMEMNKYINFPLNRTTNLPPAGEVLKNYKYSNQKELSIIYVGGISERYGLKEMLEAVYEYSKNNKVQLHLVCRKNEYEERSYIFNKYINNDWLKIYHSHGKSLQSIYSKANVAISPIKKNQYNDFAVPVKIFEYMTYGLPQIVTNCDAQANIIEKDNLGIIVEDNVAGLLKGLEFFSNCSLRKDYNERINKSLQKNHLWIRRIEKINSILTKYYYINS